MPFRDMPLSELQRLARLPAGDGGASVIRSVCQSMRVEGYPVSEDVARAAAARVLSPRE
jgi:hypothetical protein